VGHLLPSPPTETERPSAVASTSSAVDAMKSTTCRSSASWSVTATLSRTAASAHSALRPRWAAIARAHAAVSFTILRAIA
jgi:hypothetical protein